jgi:hypothetical protein
MKSSLTPIAITGPDGKFVLPEDGFVQFMPVGEYPGEVDFGTEKPMDVEGVECGPDGRWYLPIIQVIDQEALASCLASYRPDMLVDYEHRSNQPDGDSSAAGWTENAAVRADGLYCRVRWSAKGLADVTGGNYRFLSPVFPWPNLQHISGNRYRASSFDGAALTNVPNLRNIKAVSNRGNSNHAPDVQKPPLSPQAGNAGTAPEQAGQKNTPSTAVNSASDGKERNMLEKLIKELGLPPGTTEEDALKALTAMKTKLDDMDKQALAAQVENDLQTFGGRVQNREALKTALLKDRAGTLAVLQLTKPEAPPARALNAVTGKTPEADVTAKGDRARGAKIANRAKELRKGGASRQEAFRKAEAEFSEK